MTLTREQWLLAAVEQLRPVFDSAGYPLPDQVRVSVGWPSARATSKNRRIGECWKKRASKDGVCQIFISPVLATGFDALDVLTHELGHAAIDPHSGHGGLFITMRNALGLTKNKPTSAQAGSELAKVLKRIDNELGEYPHVALNPRRDEKKQSTRLLKCACATCGYTVRVTAKWLDIGAPICPTDNVEMIA